DPLAGRWRNPPGHRRGEGSGAGRERGGDRKAGTVGAGGRWRRRRVAGPRNAALGAPSCARFLWMRLSRRHHPRSLARGPKGSAMMILVWAAAVLVVVSLPYWLPSAILRLRVRIFTRINGEEGMAIPGKLVDPSRFKQIYSHPAADGRSRGAALSDLFWYWLAPGPEIHQEHIEPGDRYEQVARTTRRILSISRRAARELCTQCVRRTLHRADITRTTLVRLRDLMMPAWADFYYQLVFGEPSTAPARELIVGNANDVVTALKCCGLRHMGKRHRLTQFLIAKLEAVGGAPPPPENPSTRGRGAHPPVNA